MAVRGFRVDGHEFVRGAVDGGASAVCVEASQPIDVPQLVVRDSRAALPWLAAEVHHHPSRSLQVVGITGTNGKTTVVHLLEAIFEASGVPCAVLGTIGARIAGRSIPLGRTTPESSDLQRLLADTLRAGARAVAMEVSSHALALRRVDATRFAVAAFTNLTQDHLDFHGDMESYFAAKASLFAAGRARLGVLWTEDPYGARLASSTNLSTIRVGRSSRADVYAGDVSLDASGARFTLVTPTDRIAVTLPLGGGFNVDNALIAAACAISLDVPAYDIARGLSSVRPIPGRFERVDEGQPFSVFVDYAHSPGGIEAAIGAARAISSGAIIVVVGAGGDRDRAKRPLMGTASARADIAIITSDNPRSEDPLAIITEVASGATAGPAEIARIPDRRAAIRTALGRAKPGDVVLILGKGHEQGQEFADHVEPFDDRSVARDEILELGVPG